MTAKNSHSVFMVSKASQRYLKSRTAALGIISLRFYISPSRALKHVLQAPLSFCRDIFSVFVSTPPPVGCLLSNVSVPTKFDQNGKISNKGRQTKQNKFFFFQKSRYFQKVLLQNQAFIQC